MNQLKKDELAFILNYYDQLVVSSPDSQYSIGAVISSCRVYIRGNRGVQLETRYAGFFRAKKGYIQVIRGRGPEGTYPYLNGTRVFNTIHLDNAVAVLSSIRYALNRCEEV